MKKSVQTLVRNAQAGDIDAFGALVEMFKDAVVGAAWSSTRNFDDAEDIAQETFILAYQQLPRLREPEKFPGWLRRITMTACNRFHRSCKPAHQDISEMPETPSTAPTPDAAAQTRELKEKILSEIAALSEKNRLAATLFYIDGYTHQEISDFLETPVSTVKSRLHESRKQLKKGLLKMAKDVLHDSKPGDDFIRRLKKQLNGRIVKLPDGRAQVFYDFASEEELADWRTAKPYRASPEVKDGALAFGKVKEEETDQQWDRDLRLNLVFDPDPEKDLEISFDVTMGTNEPWSCAAWVLTSKDGYGPGIPFFYGVITDWSEEWRANREDSHEWKDGLLRADYLRRTGGGGPEDMRWIVPTKDIALSEQYRMKIVRRGRKLHWEINGQEAGVADLAEDEFCLTERLILCNYGKGTGAIFKNLVIRAAIKEIDSNWQEADRKADK